MLVLRNTFFWASDFCSAVSDLAAAPPDTPFSRDFSGWIIRDQAQFGDLHGAIAGVALHGFLGALYRAKPFPPDRAGFKQKTRETFEPEFVTARLAEFGEPADLQLVAGPRTGSLSLAGVEFEREAFTALINYVWVGGMPRWLAAEPPDYVRDTARAVADSAAPWLAGMVFGK